MQFLLSLLGKIFTVSSNIYMFLSMEPNIVESKTWKVENKKEEFKRWVISLVVVSIFSLSICALVIASNYQLYDISTRINDLSNNQVKLEAKILILESKIDAMSGTVKAISKDVNQ
jgi:outer membrane murein-binding lipoprotein Lpp